MREVGFLENMEMEAFCSVAMASFSLWSHYMIWVLGSADSEVSYVLHCMVGISSSDLYS